MRTLRTLALISCLTVSAVFAQAPAQDWRFAHPGATLVGGFRLKAMLDSPLVNALIKEAIAKDPSSAVMVGLIRSSIGGVTDIRFSVRDRGKGQDPDVLALVTGVIDDAIAGTMTQGKIDMRRIDANTLLLGEEQSLAEAMTRMSKPATGLQARALNSSKILAKHDLWLAGTLPELPMTIPVLDSLRGIALGISLQSEARIELALETASAKAAEDLVSAARQAQVQQPGLGAALLSEVDGSTARFSFAMPADQVIQAVQQGLKDGTPASPVAGLFGQPLPTFKSSVSEPAAPPKPKPDSTIRIYGLEEGTREIKSEPRN